MDAYPCIVEQMLNSSLGSDTLSPDDVYRAGVAYARWWRDDQRAYRWTREPW
jgi:hypothetical protein